MPYPYLIRGVLDALGDTRVVSDEVPLEPVTLGEDLFTPEGPARFTVTLLNSGAGIVATGEVRAVMRATCARCLCEFTAEYRGSIDGLYVDPEDEAELPDEQERELIVDDRIDLEPAVVESLLVELPFAPVHDEACAGLCATCGADLNEGPCGCPVDAGASPFTALKDLLGEPDAGEPGGS